MNARTLLAGIMAAAFLGGPAAWAGDDKDCPTKERSASERPNAARPTAGAKAQPSNDPRTASQEGDFRLQRASEMIGEEVVNHKGEKLGKISEFAVDADRGKVAYAVLETGGVLGIGEKYHAIPWKAINYRPDVDKKANDEKFVMRVEKDRIKQAEGFDKDHWPNMADQQWARSLHSYYDADPYWEDKDTLSRNEMKGQRGLNQLEGQARRDQADYQNGEKTIIKAKGQLIRRDVKDQAGNDLGDVKDLLVDRKTGKVAFVIARLDQMDDDIKGERPKAADGKKKEFAALPWRVIRWAPRGENKDADLVLQASPDQIRGQLFADNSWPNLGDERWAANVYRHYGQRPYWEGERDTLAVRPPIETGRTEATPR